MSPDPLSPDPTSHDQSHLDPTRPATIYDVARLAGVSHQTVSRFLSGTGGIRPRNRALIEDALSALNYRKNLAATSLATSRSHRLGALAYELSGTGPGKTMQGASVAARRAGYSLDIISLDSVSHVELHDALAVLNSRDLEGILATAPTDEIAEALRALPASLPVYIERGPDHPPYGAETDGHSDRPNPPSGAQLAMTHLFELGHRRIAHLGGPPRWISARDRSTGYEQAMADTGLAALPIVCGDWSAASGYACAPELFADETITAVFAANDRMALGAMRWLHEQGRRLPDDLSLIGYDDIAEAGFFYPPLTTVRQDFAGMGRFAAETLIAMIEGTQDESRGYPQPELVVRSSTAPLRGRR